MSVTTLKIKAINAETGKFQEKILSLDPQQQGDCLIGRHPSCDLVLDSAEVSRIHGRICLQDGQCFFTDLGSTDGSQIDAQDLQINQGYLLKSDQLVRIGGFILTIAPCPEQSSAIQLEVPQRSLQSPQELTVRCIQVIEETHDVKTFRFVCDSSGLFSYQPGQFVTLDLEIEGKRVKRSYSLSSSPSRPHTLEITVKRVPAGLVSNWLHDRLTVGSLVKLIGPMGKFTCGDRPARKLLLISAGSGITPMMSMSRWLCDTSADVDVIFVHSARSPSDLMFRYELESLAARYAKFQLAVTITRSEPGQAWQGYSGRLNEVMLQAIAPDFQERTVYVCGPNPFMTGVKTMLETLKLPMENYHQESFGTPKRQPSVTETEASRPEPALAEPARISSVNATIESSPVVVFAKSNKEIACDAEDMILDVAEQEGIDLPSGCRMGVCGACKLPLLAGEVNYEDDPECESGYLLACIAKPSGKVVVEA